MRSEPPTIKLVLGARQPPDPVALAAAHCGWKLVAQSVDAAQAVLLAVSVVAGRGRLVPRGDWLDRSP
ncbi:MAG: hypothetical protein Kow0010_23100 [Dehalococcoidia bacterium]